MVATEAPAARGLLGDAMTALDSKTEDGVGTANLYFRYAWGLRTEMLVALSQLPREISAA